MHGFKDAPLRLAGMHKKETLSQLVVRRRAALTARCICSRVRAPQLAEAQDLFVVLLFRARSIIVVIRSSSSQRPLLGKQLPCTLHPRQTHRVSHCRDTTTAFEQSTKSRLTCWHIPLNACLGSGVGVCSIRELIEGAAAWAQQHGWLQSTG